ncbi:MAG: autotransporter-associated beta strand repeat-containing protein, partial [Planctomycetia bacterium]|nr:autotransporter-associated beta strand repeat-containing protein [Planctomycetia bacterium]
MLAVGSAVLLACGNPLLPPLASVSTSAAADYYWDADGSSSASTGGTGMWDTTSSLWRTGSAAGALAAWPNNTGTPDSAFFSGTSGTVTIADAMAITAGGLTFTANYTIDRAGTGSLTLAGASSPILNVGTSSTATISAGIGGSIGLTKTGSGSLVLSGSNSYSGATTLTTGALRLANSNALGSSSLTVTSATNESTRAVELVGNITVRQAITVGS